MHGSCVCEARSLVCDVPPMKGSVNLSGPSPGTAPVDGAGVCIRCSLRCVLSPLVFILIARVFFKGPRMLNRMLWSAFKPQHQAFQRTSFVRIKVKYLTRLCAYEREEGGEKRDEPTIRFA